MAERPFTLVWLTGPSCDGCTVAVIGDTTSVTLESLLAGSEPDLPPVRLVHPALAFESGAEFIDEYSRAAAGELDPFGVVCEASLPRRLAAGSFAWHGEEQGRLVDVLEWLTRLAARAQFVIALGDCGVWGGPHSDDPNPSGAVGVDQVLGRSYRSALDLPVINIPGCAAPPALLSTTVALLRLAAGTGPAPPLDELGRPAGYFPD